MDGSFYVPERNLDQLQDGPRRSSHRSDHQVTSPIFVATYRQSAKALVLLVKNESAASTRAGRKRYDRVKAAYKKATELVPYVDWRDVAEEIAEIAGMDMPNVGENTYGDGTGYR